MAEAISAILSIVIIDLVLSGDNAVVIGMAARSLSPENRRKAIVLGGAGAILLRITFTGLATVLLGIPGLQAIGGVLLFYIGFKLIRPHDDEHSTIKEAGSLREAVKTIILADVVMSLDNILAVGGAARGHLGLLIFGLLLSIPIILFGSELVARLLGRFPGFLYIGVFVLLHAAVSMILHDPSVAHLFHTNMLVELLLSLTATGILIGLVRLLERSRRERQKPISRGAVAPRGE
ncbi:MAG: TerC family protein [Thermomicrobiales bacterium]|nr:TerC family protein [Thermomicrobiales bacterium]